MIHKLFYYEAPGCDPHRNLAVEQYLLTHLQPGDMVLYLWQNQNTVVLGKNQNAWAECRVSLLEQEGGKVARRLSGGGAVFHDLGNLNFTFLTCTEDYDVDRQLAVIARACEMAGLQVERSGRNDILAQGRKFSGNAFYHAQGYSYHHGTLLISADMEKLQRYLSPSKAKLEAKGVASVRSRVVNLRELNPAITVPAMKAHMRNAFCQIYGSDVTEMTLSTQAMEQVLQLQEKISGWDYLFGAPLPFSFSCSQRFSWGSVELEMDAKGGTIQAVKVYSDAMDWSLPQQIEQALTGCRFEKAAMANALEAMPMDQAVCADLIQMLKEQDI